MGKRIKFYISKRGDIYSVVGNEIAVPRSDFSGMTPDKYLKIFTNLTKDVLYPGELGTRFPRKRTEKISRMAKNHHRKFWGMGRIK